MARRCAKHFNYVVEITQDDNTWINVEFTPADAPGNINFISDEEQ